jgi:hypothetical protein
LYLGINETGRKGMGLYNVGLSFFFTLSVVVVTVKVMKEKIERLKKFGLLIEFRKKVSNQKGLIQIMLKKLN